MYGTIPVSEMNRKDKVFQTQKAERDSLTLRNGTGIIEDGILRRYAVDWLGRWKAG